MAWDETVVNILAESYVMLSACPGGAAEQAVIRTTAKYSSLPPPTFGFGNTWTDKFYWNFFPRQAWPHTDKCLGRLSRNHINTVTYSSESPWWSSATIE